MPHLAWCSCVDYARKFLTNPRPCLGRWFARLRHAGNRSRITCFRSHFDAPWLRFSRFGQIWMQMLNQRTLLLYNLTWCFCVRNRGQHGYYSVWNPILRMLGRNHFIKRPVTSQLDRKRKVGSLHQLEKDLSRVMSPGQASRSPEEPPQKRSNSPWRGRYIAFPLRFSKAAPCACDLVNRCE